MYGMHKEARLKFNKLLKEVDEEKIELENSNKPKTSFIDLKVKIAEKILGNCHFCERRCHVNRREAKKDFVS